MGGNSTNYRGLIADALVGERLDRALAQTIPDLSRERIKALLGSGQLQIDGRPVTSLSAKVKPGTRYSVEMPQAVESGTPAQDIPLHIVYEDDDLIVIDKPAGLVVHPAAGHGDGTLVNALLHHCQGQLSGIGGVARPGIVHRIDKDTSGLLVVAKNDRTHEGLSRQFAAHSIDRVYSAVVQGHPKIGKGTVTGAIGRSSHDRKKMALVEDGRGKHAITHYQVISRLRNASHIECRLETGRTHQIRVHMTSIGHALLGDPVYGRSTKGLRETLNDIGFHRQALHAGRLGFIHPVSDKKLEFSSEIPPDMQELLTVLRV